MRIRPEQVADTIAATTGQVLTYDKTRKRSTWATPAGAATFHDAETPTGAIDDVNVTFTLATAPSPAASLQLFLNGQLLTRSGADFSLSGSTITMALAPLTGDVLLAWYRS